MVSDPVPDGPLPDDTVPGGTVPPAAVADALRKAGVAEVSDSPLRRALYASDASMYRLAPAVVAYPRDADEVAAALAACTDLGVGLTCRGGGTSIAGNSAGPGVVLDFRRHLAAIESLDPAAATATVQPGVVQAELQRAAAPHGLRFGPDPSTHDRCTIGGMIGNDSCGSRSLQYGRTSDNVLALDVLTGTGRRLRLDAPGPAAGPGDDPQLAALQAVVAGGLAPIRTELGRFGRQVSGYALQHLLPERGFDVRRALVGSEGTLGIVTSATVALVRDPPHRVLAVLGYPDMIAAADAAPELLPLAPATCEGMDSRLVDIVRARRGAGQVPDLPPGSGWLLVEVTGDTEAEALSRARQVVAGGGAVAGLIITDPGHAAALWRIREQGAGLSGRTANGRPAYPGWEDSAVPAAVLGRYLRDLDALLAEHKLEGIPYGHFGDGCLHLRLDFPLTAPGGRAVLRGFVREAAALVTRYGGSLSGEHGDGRARSELLPVMYSPAVLDLFAAVKDVFDPAGVLNPGVLTRPAPLDADVRAAEIPARVTSESRLGLRYPHDGDFATAVHRCTGVGKCVASTAGTSRVMCPSYQATRDEKDSTRGRARVLQEMVNGRLVAGGWRAPEVAEALDLCLSCKACSAECPAGVDMAAYKAEVLYQAHRGRLRPRSHYALGALPRWARLTAAVPGLPALANAALAAPGLGRAARRAAGIDPRRSLPPFARQSFRDWYRSHRPPPAPAPGDPGRRLLLLIDTFTDYFSPDIGQAALAVLADAGYQVEITSRATCCAITWISTGQLDAARKILGRTVAALTPAVAAGIPVVGLEPSCTATLRSDAADLLGTPEAEALAGSVRTLAEILAATPGWSPPSLDGTAVVAQPHCHHGAVMGWDADAALLRQAGATLTRLGGCCGLAGNFGMERGHYEVSRAVADTTLLPAVSAAPGATVLADGFSCRTQLADLAGRDSVHLARLLADRLTAPPQGS